MARIEVPMPQMGESVAEGTVSKWLKSVGDTIERDEPILEISTDKVDAEIPAPVAGILAAIEVQEGETVEVGTVVAYLETEAGVATGALGGSDGEPAEPAPSAAAEPEPASLEERTAEVGEVGPSSEVAPAKAEEAEEAEEETAAQRLRRRSTPVVRRIAEEHGIEIASVSGTGHAGRVTKADILAFIAEGGARPAEPAPAPSPERPTVPSPAPTPPAAGTSELWHAFYSEVQNPEFPVREADRVEPMSKIRRLTAEHMVLAKRVAPHVHSFIEVDFTTVDRIRDQNKARWSEQGARVSYTAFVAWACSRVLREFPTLNATVSGNNIVYRGQINLGMAVDLDPGLIVPVIHDADDLGLVGIGRRIIDLAERARARQLQPAEIQGATFSITNPGVLGTLVGLPVIPKGTAAILGTGAIEKRVVAVEDSDTGADAIAVRKRSLFSLGYDHRLVDGAVAARFLARLKQVMQEFPDDA